MAVNMFDTPAMPYVPLIIYTLPTPSPLYYYYYYPAATSIIIPLKNFSFPLLNTPSCCVGNPCYPFSCPLLHHPPPATITLTPSTITAHNTSLQMNIPLYYNNFNPTLVSYYPSFKPSYQLCYPTTTENSPIPEYPKKKNSKVILKTLPFVHRSPRMKRFSALKKRYSRFSRQFYRRVKRCVSIWKPKTPSSATAATCFDFVETEADGEKTSIMIKNIPNSLKKEQLVKYMDEHCHRENQEVVLKEQPISEYDFLYLPMDFRSNLNFGYAFVNFTHGSAAVRFYRSFHNQKWNDFESNKICEIKYARLQGREQLVNSFKNSYFKCWTDDYLPTVFTPPRNGGAESLDTKQTYVGRRKQEVV